MKKGIFTISEKHERITIRYRRKKKKIITTCEECGKRLELSAEDETAERNKIKIADLPTISKNQKIVSKKG